MDCLSPWTAVEQYGLGACWVHIRNRNRMGQRKTSDEEIRVLLEVPDGYTVLNLIAIGEKGENKAPYTEQDLHMENVHLYLDYGITSSEYTGGKLLITQTRGCL